MQLVDALCADNNLTMVNVICEKAIALYSITLNTHERLTWKAWHHPIVRISDGSQWTNCKLNVLMAEGYIIIGDFAKAVERYRLAAAEDSSNGWLQNRPENALLKRGSLTGTETE